MVASSACSRTCGITLLRDVEIDSVQDRGGGARGSDIVAKWCPRADGELEAFLYSAVLGRLSMESIRCYGLSSKAPESTAAISRRRRDYAGCG